MISEEELNYRLTGELPKEKSFAITEQMKDYKIDITKEPSTIAVENIITKSLKLGYQILNAAGINRKADYIVIGNNQGVRWCDKRIFNDLHEDYVNISYREFMKL